MGRLKRLRPAALVAAGALLLTGTTVPATANTTTDNHVAANTATTDNTPYGYLMVNFMWDRVAGEEYGERVNFQISQGNDPTQWDRLNDGEPVLVSNQSTTGIRDPYLTYNPTTGTYYIITTNLRTYGGPEEKYGITPPQSTQIEVWHSQDLISWSEQTSFNVSTDRQGNLLNTLTEQHTGKSVSGLEMMWAPEATWVDDFNDLNDYGKDNGTAQGGSFVVYWSSNATYDGLTRKMVLWGANH